MSFIAAVLRILFILTLAIGLHEPSKLQALLVKLFNDVSLDLKQVTGTVNRFKLMQPKGDISKLNILSELVETLALPLSVVEYLPNFITLVDLEYNRETSPAQVSLSFKVDFETMFQAFPAIIELERSTLDIRTTANIVKPVNGD